MFRHYIKIAFRNLWKYKNQTLVSVVGLAVGFACFAIATLWIRYEMTYDSFHKNAGRIYCISQPDFFSSTGVSRRSQYPLAGYLKNTFPEIAHATAIRSATAGNVPVKLNGVSMPIDFLYIDSSFFSMFNVKILEGSMDFHIPDNETIALTHEKARQLFGNVNPVGEKVKMSGDHEFTVCAVVSGQPNKRSNYPFDVLIPLPPGEWNRISDEHTLIELLPNVDVDAFHKKLYAHTIQQGSISITKLTITPLTSVRYEDPDIRREVKFQHIIIFAVSGSLLIFCTLFNYLTLFVSRFRIRQRELALRVVFGASNRSLFALLSVEFLMSLIIALLLGFVGILEIIPVFRELSGVRLELSSIYFESLIYIAGIILISLSAFIVTLAIFRRRTLNVSIRQSNRKLFRKISIVTQLIISIVFAFCTIVILKQMYYLHNTDLGFAFKNRGSVYIYTKVDIDMLNEKIKQIPEITETVTGYTPLLPMLSIGGANISDWDDKPENIASIDLEHIDVSKEFIEFYEIKTVEGEFTYDGTGKTYINESAAKAFGWHSAVGKTFSRYKVDGVIGNIYNMSPTVTAKPAYYTIKNKPGEARSILFKFNDDAWKTCKRKIDEIIKTEYSDPYYNLSGAEEEYNKFLKSENTLLRILTLVSLICVIVCVFGFVSMVSLTCEERRKEIAIRKINGATIKDILDIFFKEYLTLLVIGALIAFPVGYLIMKRWLEGYVVQTEMSAWVYLSILLALIMAIVICVSGKVYKTSSENPVEAIKG
jgi:ABC-type antimicrobial peptide transport system permease subunit